MAKIQTDAKILENICIQRSCFRADLEAPEIASLVQPGQFLHFRLPDLEHRILRRPFSICDADPDAGTVRIVYKVVGEGTEFLSGLSRGSAVNVLGPLGNGYSPVPVGDSSVPVVVAGGYGTAATFLWARRSPVPGMCLIGGRSEEDILLNRSFDELGWDVRISTDDGSMGHRGVVTDLLSGVLDAVAASPRIIACGPNPMLRAVCRIVLERNLNAEVSLDQRMCCGMGACFACVAPIRTDPGSEFQYVRTCLEGPVFRADEVCWDRM